MFGRTVWLMRVTETVDSVGAFGGVVRCPERECAALSLHIRMLKSLQLSRPQCVKKIWEYIRENNLQDPNDKRQVICDEAMRNVFKQDKVHMFTMNKILSQNLYAQDEIITANSGG